MEETRTSQWPYSPRLRRDRTNEDDDHDDDDDDDEEEEEEDDDDDDDDDDEFGENVLFWTIDRKWNNIKEYFYFFFFFFRARLY